MKRFIEDGDRGQTTLLPDSLEDYVAEDNPVRVVDVFIDELDLEALGFSGVVPEQTGLRAGLCDPRYRTFGRVAIGLRANAPSPGPRNPRQLSIHSSSCASSPTSMT